MSNMQVIGQQKERNAGATIVAEMELSDEDMDRAEVEGRPIELALTGAHWRSMLEGESGLLERCVLRVRASVVLVDDIATPETPRTPETRHANDCDSNLEISPPRACSCGAEGR